MFRRSQREQIKDKQFKKRAYCDEQMAYEQISGEQTRGNPSNLIKLLSHHFGFYHICYSYNICMKVHISEFVIRTSILKR